MLKIENSGWVEDESWMDQTSLLLENDLDVIVYPNPFENHIQVAFSGSEMQYDSFQIVDFNGREILNGKLTDIQIQTIQLPNLRTGMYFISFKGPNGILTKQLMKM